MLFLALLIFMILWWPARWLILSEVPAVGNWPEPVIAGVFFLLCLPAAWGLDRTLMFAFGENYKISRRILRIAGTRWLSFLLLIAGGISLAMWVSGVEMEDWFVGLMVPWLIVGGGNFMGLEVGTRLGHLDVEHTINPQSGSLRFEAPSQEDVPPRAGTDGVQGIRRTKS